MSRPSPPAPAPVRKLDVAERDRLWVSTLSNAGYRWSDDEGWQAQQTISGVTEWRPVRAGTRTYTVYARSGEEFTEVTA